MHNDDDIFCSAKQNKPRKFWMITGPLNSPKVRHPSYKMAQEEADRLAAQYPGNEYIILEAVGSVMAQGIIRHKF